MSWESTRFALRGVNSMVISAPRVTYQAIPPPTASSVADMGFLVDIYEVVPASQAALAGQSQFDIPLGAGSLSYLTEGFYGLESTGEGVPYRWTSGEARIVMPLPGEALQAQGGSLWLDISAWRPDGATPPEITITVEGVASRDIQPNGGFSPQRFEFDISGAALAGQSQVEILLHSNAWTPSDHGMDDTRSLGVALFGGGLSLADDGGK